MKVPLVIATFLFICISFGFGGEVSTERNGTRRSSFVCSTDHGPNTRSGVVGRRHRWKHFKVVFNEEQTHNETELLENAIADLRLVLPCVKFETFPANSYVSGDYIQIETTPGEGCYSEIGKVGGRQIINLDNKYDACWTKGIILHEFFHALGIIHEHQRRDRDRHVKIYWENIMPGWESQFEKYRGMKVSNYGVPYNIKSVMHYPAYIFSKNGQTTITTVDGSDDVGADEPQLQPSDIIKVGRMYKCY